ncbi:hypothetical protein SAMN00790413_06108 [Deinococcus hopiensis KR-140]|uniref:Uncharacterized protein n=1 Tax=Deinococcus hopiensis KR-140 TaxID=695939 RepID=A0A1W1VWM6_9DEIO|nr:hypothetical protein SAMN00790413_06108 [Deinococcus hopiensis KR-140]
MKKAPTVEVALVERTLPKNARTSAFSIPILKSEAPDDGRGTPMCLSLDFWILRNIRPCVVALLDRTPVGVEDLFPAYSLPCA